jgi:MraZ protein
MIFRVDKFYGNIDAKADVKGRVFIPAIFRKILQGAGETKLVLRKDDHQNCLTIYPESQWINELDYLRNRLNRWDKKQEETYRSIVSKTEGLEMDTNGRILIPKKYLQMVNITHEVQFVGMGDRIELWDCRQLEKALLPQDELEACINEFLAN